MRGLSKLYSSLAILGMCGAAVTSAQNGQIRISGEMYVDYGADKKGLSEHASSGALCVVHQPECGSVGHNGREHFFSSKSHPLPPGVTIQRIDYIPFWPIGLSKTDRGGIGSEGSYGVDLVRPGQHGSLVDVHWQNACQDQWRGLPVAYQISFILSGPQAGLDAVSKINASVPATVDPGFACSRKETPGPRPGELAIESFTASWNGQTWKAGQTLVIPVGTQATLNWDVEHCGAGCSIGIEKFRGTPNHYIGTAVRQNLSPQGSLVTAPTDTVTTYTMGAYDDASQKDGVIESATVTIQLTNQSTQTCQGCQWWFFTLTSPSDCIPIAAYGTQASAAAQAQSNATNYKLNNITADQYFSDTACPSSH
jgi:hypothetical protein